MVVVGEARMKAEYRMGNGIEYVGGKTTRLKIRNNVTALRSRLLLPDLRQARPPLGFIYMALAGWHQDTTSSMSHLAASLSSGTQRISLVSSKKRQRWSVLTEDEPRVALLPRHVSVVMPVIYLQSFVKRND
jgi:hypothetical protein